MTRVLYHPNALRNEFNTLFHLARIELNSLFVCELSFNEKKSLLSFEDSNYRKEKITATCETQRD